MIININTIDDLRDADTGRQLAASDYFTPMSAGFQFGQVMEEAQSSYVMKATESSN
jgi:hypothetical protein